MLAEQIVSGLKTKFGEQSGHCACVRLKSSVGQNMRDINTAFIEFVSDEKRPMAVKRFLLRAHQCNTIVRRAAHDPLQTIEKARRARETIVADATVFVTGSISGPTAQRL